MNDKDKVENSKKSLEEIPVDAWMVFWILYFYSMCTKNFEIKVSMQYKLFKFKKYIFGRKCHFFGRYLYPNMEDKITLMHAPVTLTFTISKMMFLRQMFSKHKKGWL